MTFIHFLYTPFTGLGKFQGYRGDDWLKNRIEIFKKYTLPSLLQSNRYFIHWISFRSEERNNPLVRGLRRHLEKLRDYNFIFTFGGTCFWDDKYPNDNLKERLEITLPILREGRFKNDFVLETIQPSDDIYWTGAIDTIQESPKEENLALSYGKGYLLNAITGQLAEYNPTTHPPFYTLVYSFETFFNPVKHFEYIDKLKSHELVPKLFKAYNIDRRGFCVVVHGENISTNWNTFKGREILGEEREKILQEF